ncbi:MAG: twin-arginine translocase subunit TatC [Gammaproteobacteria bacterium]|nr:twin-arginine translocase subunit TatC [Gammaproteobacteria bacterium]MBL6819284.1 twin-arginine translocase subunit TatC [Gammaproteobacteria bacterium]MBL6898463.1 twin-arginine translocase subunit TatC [Gammaproteobacteria bacterium]
MNQNQTNQSKNSFIPHLLELRNRLTKILLFVLVIFILLIPFSGQIYNILSIPLLNALPQGSEMIAIDVASPFLIPFKLVIYLSIFIVIPYILYHLWSFIAPGLYSHEKKLIFPLIVSSSILFYLGAAFAYFVVFPLIFVFFIGIAPTDVAVMTDIGRYLDFVIALFFAFGFSFEVPIITVLLITSGITTKEKLISKRPYIIVGAFTLGMLLTPPDVISQILLALPMWLLYELGLYSSKFFKMRKTSNETEEVYNDIANKD